MMRTGFLGGALAIFLLLSGGGAGAAGLSDVILAPGAMQGATDSRTFLHERAVPEGARLPALTDGRLTVERQMRDGVPAVVLTRQEDGKTLPVAGFPAEGPDPVVLFFLESVVRMVSETSGGSPFYIRNRIREAIGASGLGEEITAEGGTMQKVVLHPFDGDANAGRLGEFAGLTLDLRFRPGQPMEVLHLSADTIATGGAYHEELVPLREVE